MGAWPIPDTLHAAGDTVEWDRHGSCPPAAPTTGREVVNRQKADGVSGVTSKKNQAGKGI